MHSHNNISVNDYILHITRDGNDTEKLTTGSISHSYLFLSVLQGVQYSITVAAIDTENRVGEMSQPIEFILDGIYNYTDKVTLHFLSFYFVIIFHYYAVPRKLDYLNCSIILNPGKIGFHLHIQSMVCLN